MEHIADVGIIATEDSLSEALSWAARGMFSVIAELDNMAPGSLEVSLVSPDQEALTVNWLNELLSDMKRGSPPLALFNLWRYGVDRRVRR